MLTAELQKALKPPKKGITLIITVGNDLRADDGIGNYIALNCKLQTAKLKIINAEDKPENIIDEAVAMKPSKVVIIDAADFNGKPGEARIFGEDSINSATISTHMFPLGAVAKIIKKDTGAEVFFLGIQPKSVALGEGFSVEVKKAADELIELINRSNYRG